MSLKGGGLNMESIPHACAYLDTVVRRSIGGWRRSGLGAGVGVGAGDVRVGGSDRSGSCVLWMRRCVGGARDCRECCVGGSWMVLRLDSRWVGGLIGVDAAQIVRFSFRRR